MRRTHLSRREFLRRGTLSALAGPMTYLGLEGTARAEIAIGAMRQQVPRLLERHQVPGVSVAIIENARVLWVEAFGVTSARNGQPVTTDTVFGAASLSKPVFAYAVMKLAEHGAIGLDQPLSTYLDTRVGESLPPTVTARSILSHTSGLPGVGGPGLNPAGMSFAYSPRGYMTLQGAVEHQRGSIAALILNRHVFAPLGMTHSRLGAPWGPGIDLATGHSAQGPQRRTMGLGVASGMYTTAADYARFLLAVMRASHRWDPFRLSVDAVTEMLTPRVRVTEAIGWSLGWGTASADGEQAIWHWGDGGGFRNLALFYRNRGLGLVVLTNGHRGPSVYREVAQATIGAPDSIFEWIDAHS